MQFTVPHSTHSRIRLKYSSCEKDKKNSLAFKSHVCSRHSDAYTVILIANKLIHSSIAIQPLHVPNRNKSKHFEKNLIFRLFQIKYLQKLYRICYAHMNAILTYNVMYSQVCLCKYQKKNCLNASMASELSKISNISSFHSSIDSK